jgi:proline dehydrogenase
MGIFQSAAIACLPLLPRPLMRLVASRYIAGESMNEAIAKLEELAGRGFRGIIDILGEDVADADEARSVLSEYAECARRQAQAKLDSYVSVKPTHLGLRISEELCFELYLELAKLCKEQGMFLRVEMEDHSTTDATLRIFERLRQEADNVGLVLQARLFRTQADIANLAEGQLSIRMTKGIYLEPAEMAHVKPAPIRDAYVQLTRQLFERGAYVSLATHDEAMGETLIELIRELKIPTERYEFQVLLGVQEQLWSQWKKAGHPVRVYVPYGPEWRAYSTRRLRKNPQIFGHVLRDTLRFGRRP